MNPSELLHYLRVGGPTLAVIVVCSFLALAVAIERALALWRVGEITQRLAEGIGKHLLRGDAAAARASADRSDALTAGLFRVGFERLERTGEVTPALSSAVDRERTQVSLRLKKHLWLLGTIGAVAPFVGLFGTVAGIMHSFSDLGLDVGRGGTGGTAVVMAGISEALITTAAGILVAVEAVVLYNYFQARISKLAVELRLIAEEFVELLAERPLGAAPPASRGPASAEVPAPQDAAAPVPVEGT